MKSLFIIFLFTSLALFIPPETCCAKNSTSKSVLIAILARNKAHVLPRYLKCIENLYYDKSAISIYINTNNNIDDTKQILEAWIKDNEPFYETVIYDAHELPAFDTNEPHTWTKKRFKVLGGIRNKSIKMAKKLKCDYYFVADCDNFIASFTLEVLVAKDKPIIAPLLFPIPELKDRYSNFFAATTSNGYYREHPDYNAIFLRSKIGTFKVPVVHCTYLIKSEFFDKLTYTDETDDYEFVIFSRSARKNNVDQYICNEYEFGELIHFNNSLTLKEEKQRMESYFMNP